MHTHIYRHFLRGHLKSALWLYNDLINNDELSENYTSTQLMVLHVSPLFKIYVQHNLRGKLVLYITLVDSSICVAYKLILFEFHVFLNGLKTKRFNTALFTANYWFFFYWWEYPLSTMTCSAVFIEHRHKLYLIVMALFLNTREKHINIVYLDNAPHCVMFVVPKLFIP